MSAVVTRLKDALAHRGFFRTLMLVLKQPFNVILNRTPLFHYIRQYRTRRFDQRFGVETSGTIQLNHLDIMSDNKEHGQRYEATDPHVFRDLLARLHIKHEEFSFVDFGSGKGLILLLASDFPFQRIVGVEFSQELHDIAERNLRRYTSATQRCRDLTALCLDASQYELPADKLVLYFGNPFGVPVMEKVLANIERSLSAHPRQVFIVYFNPTCRELFDEARFLRGHTSKDWCAIYESRDQGTPVP